MSQARVLILGSGSVATYLASYLQQDNNNAVGSIVVASRSNSAKALANTINLTGVLRSGYSSKKISSVSIDVNNISSLADFISKYHFTHIVNVTRGISGFKYGALGSKMGIEEYGMWTPFSYELFQKIAEAALISGFLASGGLLINSSLPDITIPILIKSDARFRAYRRQILGSGNIYHLAGRFNLFFRDSRVAVYGSHCTSRLATSGYYSEHPELIAEDMIAIEEKVSAGGIWESSRVSNDILLQLCEQASDFDIQKDKYRNQMNASSNYNLIVSSMKPNYDLSHYVSHASGFEGRVGGYPIIFDRRDTAGNGVIIPRIHPTSAILGEEAIEKVNLNSMKSDGILAIDDEKITFTDELYFKGKDKFKLPRFLKYEDFSDYRQEVISYLKENNLI